MLKRVDVVCIREQIRTVRVALLAVTMRVERCSIDASLICDAEL
jgi:hypothetical protein